jgi:triosephosphate isomerase
MKMRRKILVGNWKMNGNSIANAKLLESIKSRKTAQNCDVAVCAPAPYLAQCHKLLTGSSISWGTQDVSAHNFGPYTGEVSPGMLREFGCQYSIIGHSERRLYHSESDELVAQKVISSMGANITPIICVGETSLERETGRTDEVIKRQLEAVLDTLDGADLGRIIVAYEPIWAIGTGKIASPKMAQDAHLTLRSKLITKNPESAANVRILYGGSMNSNNASGLLSMPDIDGGLVGGASLNADEFLKIITAAVQ